MGDSVDARRCASMPWKETSPVIERLQFIHDSQSGLYVMSELCERYGISRKTGYKWLERFEEDGKRGLGDRSRAPKHCPHRIDEPVAKAICEARLAHPTWGPRRVLSWLGGRHPRMSLPGLRTAGDLLPREGIVKKRVPR